MVLKRNDPVKTSPLPRTHRLRKWLVRVCFLASTIAVLLGVGLLLTPTLVSTQTGTRWVMGYLNDAIAGEVRITRMQLAWFGGQSVEGLELVDASGQVVAKVGSLTLPELSLWQGLWGSRHLGTIELGQVRADLVRHPDGTYNLTNLFASSAPVPEGDLEKESSPSPKSTGPRRWDDAVSSWSAQLAWHDVQLTFAAPGMAPLAFTSQDGTVDMRQAQALKLDFTAALTQGDATSDVSAKGTIHDLFNAAGKMTLDQAQGDLTVSATDFPLHALDRLMNLEGRWATLLGSTLQANLTASGSAHALNLLLHVQSDQLTVQLNLTASPDALTLKGPSQMQLIVTPQTWSIWVPQVTLDEPMTIAVTLDKLTIPQQGRQLVFADTEASLQVTLSDSRLQLPNLGAIALSDTHVQLHTRQLSQHFQAKVDSRVLMGEQPRPAQLTASVTASPMENRQGQLDWAHLMTEVDLVDFPVAWVDQHKLTAWKWLPILGPTASIHGQGNVPRDISFSAQSDTASLTGRVGLDGPNQLILREDLVATLRITPLMAREFLGAIHPMFQDAVQSQTPVRMVVNASDKPLPLGNVNISDIQLSGTLDGGTVMMRRGGWMDESVLSLTHAILDVTSLRQSGNGRPDQLATYPATFTLMSWTLDQGILDASQTWMTSSDLALGFVGSVDLRDLAHPTIRQMVMGVLEASLIIERPMLRRFIEPDQIADLPLSGPLNNPVVDRGIFIQDIAGSFAVQTTRENLGEFGGLLGGLIEGVGRAIKDDRQKKMGVTWHPPPAALALIEKAKRINQPHDSP